MLIFSGECKRESASSWICFGMVAEKNRVCFESGIRFIIFFTSERNPRSSILSASSRTRSFTYESFIFDWEIRSSSLPGVATTISTHFSMALIWWKSLTQPNTVVYFIFVSLQYTLHASHICTASSRVGAIISASILRFIGPSGRSLATRAL